MPTTLVRNPARCQPAPSSVLIDALRSAMRAEGASIADAALWCDVTPATIKRWLNGSNVIAVERVMGSKRLWPHFRASLLEYRRASERRIPIASSDR